MTSLDLLLSRQVDLFDCGLTSFQQFCSYITTMRDDDDDDYDDERKRSGYRLSGCDTLALTNRRPGSLSCSV